MSCDNNWRTMQGHMWKPGKDRDDRWAAFKNAWAKDHNVFFDRNPDDHVHRHVLWEPFKAHLQDRDGWVTPNGDPNPTSYFSGLHALDQTIHDFMFGHIGDMARIEVNGQGTIKGYVQSSTGEYFGMGYYGDSANNMPPGLFGLCDEAFVFMYYKGGCWNVRTAFPSSPKL